MTTQELAIQDTTARAVDPEIIALAAAFFTAGEGRITKPQAVKAAYFFHSSGQVEGRDSYIGTSGKVAGRVLEGYRGVTKDAAERGAGEVKYEFRPVTAQEAEENEIEPGDMAIACEVYQLRAWRLAKEMGERYSPIVGIGIIKKAEKTDRDGRPIPMQGGYTWAKKVRNRAYKEAFRHLPGMAIDAEEVLDEAERAGVHVELPDGAKPSREQALALVEQAERLAIAGPAEDPAETLRRNVAAMRGPEVDGFDDDEPPAVQQPPARPTWADPVAAQSWAMQQVDGAGDPVFKARRHCENAYAKLRAESLASASPPTNARQFFDLWYQDVLRRVAEADERLQHELDRLAASEEPQF